jgi:hypothetical protein
MGCQVRKLLGDRRIVIPPAERPIRITLPSLSDAASLGRQANIRGTRYWA